MGNQSMKVFIPYVDGRGGVDAPLVPFNHQAMRVVRLEVKGDQTDAVCKVIMEIQRDHTEYHIEPKTRYGDVTGTKTIDI